MVKKRRKKEEIEIVSNVLKGIGEAIPPLSGLMKTITKMEDFKKRLKDVDEEIREKLKETPFKKEDLKVEVGHAIRTIFPESKKKTKRGIKPKKTKRKHLVDVFDEKNKVRIVTELRNVKAKDIKTELKDKTLTITAKTKKRTIRLPCAVKKQIKKQYKNGILEIVFKK